MGQTLLCCMVMLWPWPSRKRPKCCFWHVVSIWWSILWNSLKIRYQITKLWAGHHNAARSCCDLELQGSNPNVAHDTSSHVIFSLKKFSNSASNNEVTMYGPDTILLPSHSVTLTSKVVTQMNFTLLFAVNLTRSKCGGTHYASLQYSRKQFARGVFTLKNKPK